jgi:glycosyltransferase involved in cell wall biosynthesis
MSGKTMNNKNVCMIAYRPLPKFMNRIKIARSVYDSGFSVDFICPKESGESSYDLIDGINVHRTEDNFGEWNSYLQLLGKYLIFCIRSFLLILKLNKDKKYSYFHIHTPPDFLIIAALPFKLFYKSKIVLDLHDMLPESVGSNLKGTTGKIVLELAKLIEKVSICFSDAVICTNPYDKEIVLSRNKLNPDKIFVVMNVPNLNQIGLTSAEKSDFNLEEQFIVLFQGTVWERRGIQTVVEAVESLQDKMPILFLIVGDGPYQDKLRNIVEEKGISSHVKFTGWVDQTNLSRYISVSDVCVIPFLRTKVNERGVPNKLFEYTVHGKPVCASNLKGMNFTFSKEEVAFFEPGDAKDLATKIEWCYNNPGLSSEMVSRAKKRYLLEYTWDRMESELHRCYGSI